MPEEIFASKRLKYFLDEEGKRVKVDGGIVHLTREELEYALHDFQNSGRDYKGFIEYRDHLRSKLKTGGPFDMKMSMLPALESSLRKHNRFGNSFYDHALEELLLRHGVKTPWSFADKV